MKLKYIFLLPALAVLGACSDSKENGGDNGPADGAVEIKLTTSVDTRAAVTTDFGNGDAMNLYAKAYNSAESNDKFPARKAEFADGAWTLSPRLYVQDGELAFLYAVAPYNASYTDPAKIPVKLSDQIDLLYSGTGVPVNYQNTTAKMTMRHAFSLVSFNISSMIGNQEITSVSITGSNVYSAGTFNAEKGRFTGTDKTQYTHPVSATLTSSWLTKDLPQMWMIPFSTKQESATLTAVIGGKTYTVDLPEVEMTRGTQYVFRLVLGNLGLEFVEGGLEIIPLDQADDEYADLKDYGMLRFSVKGSEWTLPTIQGHSVFGRYSVNDAEEKGTYRVDRVQTLKFNDPSRSNSVALESWNSTGFTLDNIEGLEEIDLTNY